ncbi:MAG TPA: penicillin-binding protein 2 [Ignavibacteriales bacterium]|nr:penicillin-binding protein 2 [Ignavibacteriales bacterium]
MTNSRKFGTDVRKSILYYILVSFCAVLVFQLFNMQVIKHEFFDEKSADNSIKGIVQTPLRGVFYDRNYKIVVNNKPSYTLLITPSSYNRKLNNVIETVIGAEPGYIDEILEDNIQYSKYIPIRVQRDVSFQVISWIEENKEQLPGVSYIVDMEREYPDSIMASHMFGYTKEISRKQLEADKGYYDMGDFIGNNGIEKTYEKYLRGVKGVKYMLVDSRRREIGRFKDGLNDKESIKGDDLVLTIDADAQKAAERGFKGLKGALVAIEPKTGEIIAFVSSPEYDLNNFTTVTPKEIWRNLNSDPDKPLYNRATLSVLPPGSTFKPLAAIAALEEGVITPQTVINCPGGFYFGRFFKCHGGPHGPMTVEHALEKSCNTFFYQLILRIGLDKWSDYAKRFGFGHKTGVDISEENRGIVPSTEYYNKRYGPNGWTKGFIVSLGIGQGELSVTPMQLAKYVSLIANDGKSVKPHLVRGYMDPETKKLVPFKFDPIDTKVSKKTMEIVKHGMYLVVNGAGTAGNAKIPGITVAGKTGTAQNPRGKDHAWFMGFAPYEDPKIAVAVLVENAGFGATWAAPIAKSVMMAYLNKSSLPQNQTVSKDSNGLKNQNALKDQNVPKVQNGSKEQNRPKGEEKIVAASIKN